MTSVSLEAIGLAFLSKAAVPYTALDEARITCPTDIFLRTIKSYMIAVFITILIGLVFLSVQISFTSINFPLLLLSMAIGVNMLALMGLILAGSLLLLVHHMWELGAAVAGSLFLFSGAIFPLETLPPALRWVGYLNPITYWLELLRRSLVPSIAGAYPTFSNLNEIQILGILVGLTAAFAIISALTFRWCDRRARQLGIIDMVTNY